MIPGVEEVSQLFDEADKKRGKGKKRCSYKSKGTQTKIMEDIPTEELIQEEAIAGHFVSSEGNFIPNKLSDYYFVIFYGKVPDEWVELFQSSNALGSKAVRMVQYVK